MSASARPNGPVASATSGLGKALKSVFGAALVLGLLMVGAAPAHATPLGTIDTFAGSGPAAGPTLATSTAMLPWGVAGHGSDVFVSDTSFNVVRKIDSSGEQVVVAGDGTSGSLGDEGLATAAQLNNPQGLAVDAAGNLFIADTYNLRIRVVAAASGEIFGQTVSAGDIYTVAGDGAWGSGGEGGPATAAELRYPEAVAVDTAGDLFIADSENYRVLVVPVASGSLFGLSVTAGNIYTIAGSGTWGFSGDGGPGTAADLTRPIGVAVDGSGNLVIADSNNNRIRVVAASSATFYGQSMTEGDIYTVAGDGSIAFDGDGGPATSASFAIPNGVAFDGSGNLIVADSSNQRVRVIAGASNTFYGQSMTEGSVYTVAGDGTPGFAGDGGPSTDANLDGPTAVTVDGSGNLVFSDMSNGRLRVVAVSSATRYSQSMTEGDIYTVAGNGSGTFSGEGGPAADAQLTRPGAVALDSSGDVFIADSQAERVRVVAAESGTVLGVSVTAGDIYTVAGNGTYEFSGDGGPATDAGLANPGAVAVDPSGNLLIADSYNNRVRVVAASTGTFYGQSMTLGDIYTIAGDGNSTYAGDGGAATAAPLNDPEGLAFDASGNLVIADSNNNVIRVVAAATDTFYGQSMTEGDIYTIAGDGTYSFAGDEGPATSAQLAYPTGVSVDSSGNVLVADYANNRVRVVAASSATFYGTLMTEGDIYTVVGGGWGSDGSLAAEAYVSSPWAVVVDSSGDLLISDTGHSSVRMVPATSGTIGGRSVAANHIYTVAGDGTSGFSGDGGPATAAHLDDPAGMAVGASGELFVADRQNDRVRSVSGVLPVSTPGAPDASVGAVSTHSVTLVWTPPADDGGSVIEGYDVFQGSSPGGEGADPVAWADGTTTHVTIHDLVTGTPYYFTVAAYNGIGEGPPSTEVEAIPAGAPPNATAGFIATLAGGGAVPGPAAAANTGMMPYGVAVHGGKLYVSDPNFAVVRTVDSAGSQVMVAGDGTSGYEGDGGPAAMAQLDYPQGIAVDSSGNLYIADTGAERVRMVAATSGNHFGHSMTAGDIYTVAGNGDYGVGDDGVPATGTSLYTPNGVAVDGSGNLLIADSDSQRVRVVASTDGTFYGQSMTAGDIYTIAGTGTSGYNGDRNVATSALLYYPNGVAVDASGNILIADTYNYVVRVVAAHTATYYGQSMTQGDIYTVAGSNSYGYSGDGGPATSAEMGELFGVSTDASGNLVISDSYNDAVRVVAAASGTFYGQSMTQGDIYTITGTGTFGYSGDGGPATDAELGYPRGLAVDGSGNLVVADDGSNAVRLVATASGAAFGMATTAGDIYTVAGNGTYAFGGDRGAALDAQLDYPSAVAVDSQGNAIVTDTYNDRVRVRAAHAGTFYGQAMMEGAMYTIAGNGTHGATGDGGAATSAELAGPQGVAIDGAGNVLVGDTGNQRVRVVAASSGTFYGLSMTAGDIYTIAGTGSQGFSGDGGSATDAQLYSPIGLALDAAGNVLVVDYGNSRVRVVAVATGTFYGQSMSAGFIYTIAGNGTQGASGDGGAATGAQFNRPMDVAVDGAGNVLVADSWNHKVRAVAAHTATSYGVAMTAGDIYTIAGDGYFGYYGDGGPPTAARLAYPEGVTVDPSGNLLIADSSNARVRMVPASSGTYYGVSMTGGDIFTVAGDGSSGADGDGGPATWAQLDNPLKAAVDASGNLVIADQVNNRLRMVYASSDPIEPSAPVMGLPGLSGQSVTLSWIAPAYDGGTPVTGYKVYEATTAGGEAGTTPVDVPAGTTTLQLNNLTYGTTYHFVVTARNAVGEGAPSNEVAVPLTLAKPSAPTGLGASVPKSGPVTLSWTDHGSGITSHRIRVYTYKAGTKRSPAPTIKLAIDQVVSGSSTSWPTKLAGQMYVFEVLAHNAAGDGPFSAQYGPFKG